MENTNPRISSLETSIAYIEHSDLANPKKQQEAVNSLKQMRFLVIKNVPGIKEAQDSLFKSIQDLPQIFAENPHAGIINYQNRYHVYNQMQQDEDGQFQFIPDSKDTQLLQVFKKRMSQFSKIKSQITLQVLDLMDSHVQVVMEEKGIKKDNYQPLRSLVEQNKERKLRSIFELSHNSCNTGYSTVPHKDMTFLTCFPAMKFWKEGQVIDAPLDCGLFIDGPDGESIKIVTEENDLCFQTGFAAQIFTGKIFQACAHYVPATSSSDVLRGTHIEFFHAADDLVMNPPFQTEANLIYNKNEFKAIPMVSNIFWKKDLKFSELHKLASLHQLQPMDMKVYEEVNFNGHLAMVLSLPWATSVSKKAAKKVIEDDRIYFTRATMQPKWTTYKCSSDNLHVAVSLLVRKESHNIDKRPFIDACRASVIGTLAKFGVPNVAESADGNVLMNGKFIAILKQVEKSQGEHAQIITSVEIGLNAEQDAYELFPTCTSVFIQSAQKVDKDEFFEAFAQYLLRKLDSLRDIKNEGTLSKAN